MRALALSTWGAALALSVAGCSRDRDRAPTSAGASTTPSAVPSAKPAPRPQPASSSPPPASPSSASRAPTLPTKGSGRLRLDAKAFDIATGSFVALASDRAFVRTKAGALLSVTLPEKDKPARLAEDGSTFARARTALTTRFAYFVSNGKLTRLPLAGGDAETLADDAEEIAPAALSAGTREVVAYVAKRRTKDGERRAKLWVDAVLVDLSQEGSGGTAVALAAAGDGAVWAGWLDQRTALVPVHVAEVKLDPLTVSRQRVTWNAPPSDQPMEVSLVPTGGGVASLLATPKDGVSFGLAVVPLGKDTREDAVWSTYPNGLDPAPAVGIAPCDRPSVALVRPTAKAPDSPRSVVLAEVRDDGTLADEREVATAKQVDHLAAWGGASGGWIAWAGDGRTWVRRVRCG